MKSTKFSKRDKFRILDLTEHKHELEIGLFFQVQLNRKNIIRLFQQK